MDTRRHTSTQTRERLTVKLKRQQRIRRYRGRLRWRGDLDGSRRS